MKFLSICIVTVRKILNNDNITTKKKALVFKQLLPSIFENWVTRTGKNNLSNLFRIYQVLLAQGVEDNRRENDDSAENCPAARFFADN